MDRPAASGDLCILLPQGTCRRIARVLEGSSPLQFLLRAQLLESLVRHIDLAAHLQKLRRIFQRLGDAFDCPDVLGHILAYHAVAAGGRPDEFSVLILQTAGKPSILISTTYSGSMPASRTRRSKSRSSSYENASNKLSILTAWVTLVKRPLGVPPTFWVAKSA